MKAIKGLWEQIATFENLYAAYRSAAKGKRFRDEVLAFSALLEDNLFDLRDDLLNGTYKVGNYREFYVYEPKKRLVMALPFRDRVAQWAVYRILNPIIAKGYIEDSFACIDGRGIHTASKRLKYFAELVTRENGESGYYLKLDIAKYFYRINHDVLMGILRQRFADKPLLDLLERIVRSELPFGLQLGASPGDGTERIHGCGMPIGNLTSQMFANLYLNELDQYVKRELHVHCFVRYMDDMVIIAKDKQTLREYRQKIEAFLNDRLNLNLNDKTVIRPMSLGIDFCGFKIWDTHIKLRKPTAMKMRHRLKKLQKDYTAGTADLADVRETLASYNGMLKFCDSYRLCREIFGVYGEHGGEWYDGWFTLRHGHPDEPLLKQ
jgi:retron-type reverse transcriptase